MNGHRRASDSDKWIIRHLEVIKWLVALIFAGGMFYQHQRDSDRRLTDLEKRVQFHFGSEAVDK
jgi:hypothetical protein